MSGPVVTVQIPLSTGKRITAASHARFFWFSPFRLALGVIFRFALAALRAVVTSRLLRLKRLRTIIAAMGNALFGKARVETDNVVQHGVVVSSYGTAFRARRCLGDNCGLAFLDQL